MGVMLQKMPLKTRRLDDYHRVIGAKQLNEIRTAAEAFRGKRVLYINSASSRGGVVAILANLVPLMKSLGINAEWYSLANVPKNFYKVTRRIHVGLQSRAPDLNPEQWHTYESFNRRLANSFDFQNWDYVMVQDHQLAAVLSYVNGPNPAKWLWRSHVDSIDPTPSYAKHLLKHLVPYDGVLFTESDFVFKGYQPKHLKISPVAIDAFSFKNSPMTKSKARAIVSRYGINIKRPLVSQISRFDPMKDLPGVIAAWKLAKQQLPNLQLAIVGNFSLDDPRANAIARQLHHDARGIEGVHIITNRAGQRAIKAFQVASNVVLQKSIREGFGLTVSEALWSKTPVIGGNVGGIRLQIINGQNGYLVNNIEECAERIIELISNPARARAMGMAGHERVRRHFLLPRLLKDEIDFMREVS